MATKMEKPVTREITIGGVRVNVSISAEGVEYQPVGRRSTVTIDHDGLVKQLLENAESKAKASFKDAGLTV
ncbi:MAG: hypothetical protein H7338_17225 [Candidatus Sericytochromatia bacterium]|nr:hypothetical protein [Candidatus Sericytochromatia bacterium]